MKNNQSISCISCSIFKKALNYINNKNNYNLNIKYFNSMLHMNPEKFSKEVFTEIDSLNNKRENVLVVYGDCHPNMSTMLKYKKIQKISGVNCIELFLGTSLYKKYQKERTFFLLPEWIEKWREVFKDELGFFDDKIAKDFMKEFFDKILFIHIEGLEIKSKSRLINEISLYSGLKVEHIHITTDIFEKNVKDALILLNQGGTNE